MSILPALLKISAFRRAWFGDGDHLGTGERRSISLIVNQSHENQSSESTFTFEGPHLSRSRCCHSQMLICFRAPAADRVFLLNNAEQSRFVKFFCGGISFLIDVLVLFGIEGFQLEFF